MSSSFDPAITLVDFSYGCACTGTSYFAGIQLKYSSINVQLKVLVHTIEHNKAVKKDEVGVYVLIRNASSPILIPPSKQGKLNENDC